MSNAQADRLRIEVLSSQEKHRTFLMLKPATIKSKHVAHFTEGVLIGSLDPLHLRIVRGEHILARARLGRIDTREVIHIVSTDPEPLPTSAKPKHRILEVRLKLITEGVFSGGSILEYDEALSRDMLILIDGQPYAMAEMVEYDNEPMVRITRMLHG
jgi:hypothetical protein